jgi:hypothetical protein
MAEAGRIIDVSFVLVQGGAVAADTHNDVTRKGMS